MEEESRLMEKVDIEKKKSYPAVLRYVVPEYDPVRKVYSVRFVYEVYIGAKKTRFIDDIFYLWDNPKYRSNALKRLNTVLEMYNLNLISKDFRSELSIVNACSWMTGTKVELMPYSYKGMRYKVLSTERKNCYRTNVLWECMLNDDLDSFPECINGKEKKLWGEILSSFEKEISNHNNQGEIK